MEEESPQELIAPIPLEVFSDPLPPPEPMPNPDTDPQAYRIRELEDAILEYVARSRTEGRSSSYSVVTFKRLLGL